MPNVTISVSEELRAEMDAFAEVSWSEICRHAISGYIAQRKNPTPKIELSLRHARLTHYDHTTGYPTLSIDLKIHNRMDSEITVDRIIAYSQFFEPRESRAYAIGIAYDLRKKVIPSNSSGAGTIFLRLPREKIAELKDVFASTFDCHVRCLVFVEGFRNEYNQEVKTRIPIDDWNSVVSKAIVRQRRGE